MIYLNHKKSASFRFVIATLTLFFFSFTTNGFAQKPRPIVIDSPEEEILERMERAITLDVRDMNVVDVIKFLALKGESKR